VVVTPTLSSQFIIQGAASLSGKLTYVFAPGTYVPHEYDFLTATDGVTGNFTSVTYNGAVPAILTHSTNALTASANLQLAGGSEISQPAGSQPVGGQPATPQTFVIAPADSALFSDQSQALAETTQQSTDLLLDKGVNGGAAASAACATGAQLAPANISPRGTSLAGAMTSAAASAFCQAGGWVEADGAALNDTANAGYSADTAGFTAGIDRLFAASGARLGFAIGYDTTNLNDSAGGQASTGVTRLSLYASQPVSRFNLAGALTYGIASDTTTRASGIARIGESHGANLIAGGVQAQTSVSLGDFNLVPAAGLRFADINGASFAESGQRGLAAAFALDGDIPAYLSVQPYLGLGLTRTFTTDSGVAISPNVFIGYQVEVANRGQAARLTAADGTLFTGTQTTNGTSAAQLAAGMTAGHNNWALYANYAAQISGTWTSQTGEAGLRISF
jgi:hypothetical protein